MAREIHYGKKEEIINEDIYSKKGRLLKHFKASDFVDNTLKKGAYYTEKQKMGLWLILTQLLIKAFRKQPAIPHNFHTQKYKNHLSLIVFHYNLLVFL